MLSNIFKGLFDDKGTTTIGVTNFILCIVVSLILGIIIALSYMYRSDYTCSFVTTLALLPAVVCVVIMMVNGNIGTSVAVAGAFGLVRFRSIPGTAKEIGTLFLAMSAGLIAGMGYLGYSFLFTIIMAAVFVIYNMLGLATQKKNGLHKNLCVTIPENLDYTGVFDDIFEEFLSFSELVSVKTTNMGSMFRLTYEITLKDSSKEKEMIDKLRCRNGNLEINVSRKEQVAGIL